MELKSRLEERDRSCGLCGFILNYQLVKKVFMLLNLISNKIFSFDNKNNILEM